MNDDRLRVYMFEILELSFGGARRYENTSFQWYVLGALAFVPESAKTGYLSALNSLQR